MVMFRDFTKRGARALGLTGFVRNNPDGTVTATAEGAEPELQKLIKRIHRGSLLSRVDEVKVEWKEATGEYKSFDIMY